MQEGISDKMGNIRFMTQPIALSFFDSKPATSEFIHQSVSTSVQVLDKSTQTLDLLVTQLHLSALIVLGLPWLQSTNPIVDWLNLTLAFRSGPKSSLPPLTVAMSCVIAAPRHEEIIPHISPLFVSIPELQCTDTSESRNMTLPAEPNFPAVNGTQLVTPKFPDNSNLFQSLLNFWMT